MQNGLCRGSMVLKADMNGYNANKVGCHLSHSYLLHTVIDMKDSQSRRINSLTAALTAFFWIPLSVC